MTRTDAEQRAIAKAGRDYHLPRDGAAHLIDHSFTGRLMLLHELWLDLGRAVLKALPAPLQRLVRGS